VCRDRFIRKASSCATRWARPVTSSLDGHDALVGELDRSESAVWTTNSYAVAWTLWCLRQEIAIFAA